MMGKKQVPLFISLIKSWWDTLTRTRFLGWMVLVFVPAEGSAVQSVAVTADLSKLTLESVEDEKTWASMWKLAPEQSISLMAQPMVVPKPKKTLTPMIWVKSVHDDAWIAFQLSWSDENKSVAGRPGDFSDAVAVQFPANAGTTPPPVFMGFKDNPVHIFHWRAQYQLDKEHGLRSMKDLYPNMNPDMYPLEFKDEGHLTGLSDEKREVFSHGRAAGNPQSYAKKGVDEILAEGFGTSSVIQNVEALAHGVWSEDQKQKGWSVVIKRPLRRESGSVLEVGKPSFMAFAVWQGGDQEVGSRKSVTMSWIPLEISKK